MLILRINGLNMLSYESTSTCLAGVEKVLMSAPKAIVNVMPDSIVFA